MPARILIIDDEEHIRTSLTCFLEDFEEFHLRAAHSAEAALAELRQEKADLCIVDLRLPGMNGADFIRFTRSEGLCSSHILHTGSTDFRRFIDISELGMTDDDVFLKPCDSMAMLRRMQEMLGRR